LLTQYYADGYYAAILSCRFQDAFFSTINRQGRRLPPLLDATLLMPRAATTDADCRFDMPLSFMIFISFLSTPLLMLLFSCR